MISCKIKNRSSRKPPLLFFRDLLIIKYHLLQQFFYLAIILSGYFTSFIAYYNYPIKAAFHFSNLKINAKPF